MVLLVHLKRIRYTDGSEEARFLIRSRTAILCGNRRSGCGRIGGLLASSLLILHRQCRLINILVRKNSHKIYHKHLAETGQSTCMQVYQSGKMLLLKWFQLPNSLYNMCMPHKLPPPQHHQAALRDILYRVFKI